MAAQTLNYLDAISHLPVGGTLILTDVSWEDYDQLLTDLGATSALKITYDRGRLEVMSPSQKHERFKEIIARIVYLIADEMDIPIESLGSTTYKQEWLARGVEPDACFYVQNAAKIIGSESLDLRACPPPDIVVEIDIADDSKSKLSIYAEMGVPELWRYDEHQFFVYRLERNLYVEMPVSLSFPLLTTQLLAQLLEQSKTEGQSATLRSLREWIHHHKV
ncbi:MAG: hypothetical protein DMF69_03240 [Acidobacteria bacterium]|nr:MAG: hypothetical protein DMF69_03240 [Acidobacteriota bacterium]